MQRHTQTEAELLNLIAEINVDWRDDHYEAFEQLLSAIPDRTSYKRDDIEALLDMDFDAAWTAVRVILDLPKDGFSIALRREMGQSSVRKTAYNKDRKRYLAALEALGVLEAMDRLAERDYSWKDLLAERLKAGRGTAIKGQRRGRALEDFAEELIRRVFDDRYESRCSFVGADGKTRAKCDFAIPSSEDPRIVVESKAYGATGSKQSDVLGDAERIIHRGRSHYWRSRPAHHVPPHFAQHHRPLHRVRDFDHPQLHSLRSFSELHRLGSQSAHTQLGDDDQ